MSIYFFKFLFFLFLIVLSWITFIFLLVHLSAKSSSSITIIYLRSTYFYCLYHLTHTNYINFIRRWIEDVVLHERTPTSLSLIYLPITPLPILILSYIHTQLFRIYCVHPQSIYDTNLWSMLVVAANTIFNNIYINFFLPSYIYDWDLIEPSSTIVLTNIILLLPLTVPTATLFFIFIFSMTHNIFY